jgi:hypothetical protein
MFNFHEDSFNYNADACLLRNYRQSKHPQTVTVASGHIWAGDDGYIARCTDDKHAIGLLTEAGYSTAEIKIQTP